MRVDRLRETLEEFRAGDDPVQRVAQDPVRFVHRYADPRDQEIVGLLAAGLAYGRVASIGASLERLLALLGPTPSRFDPRREGGRLRGFVHRFTRGADVAFLLDAVQAVVAEHGSLGAAFAREYRPEHPDVGPALSALVTRLAAHDPLPTLGQETLTNGARYFLPDPARGSACKRLCLFLRWMVRPADGVDLGLWSGVPRAALVVPLDTHLHRISRSLGLTSRRSADWKAAREVTEALRALDPDDPVKYDFALCHLGISGRCRHRRGEECATCALAAVCQVATG